jgi:hypothetical protein
MMLEMNYNATSIDVGAACTMPLGVPSAAAEELSPYALMTQQPLARRLFAVVSPKNPITQ